MTTAEKETPQTPREVAREIGLLTSSDLMSWDDLENAAVLLYWQRRQVQS